MTSNNKDNEVGYRKPPQKHQFKKGESGNPKGRPKINKPRNFTNAMVKGLCTAMDAKQNGKLVEVMPMEYIVEIFIRRAMNGDMSAIRFIMNKVFDPSLLKGAFLEYTPKPPKDDVYELSEEAQAAVLGIRRLMLEQYEKEHKNKPPVDWFPEGWQNPS